MDNFVSDIKRLMGRFQYTDASEKDVLVQCREAFPNLSDDDFRLLWAAATLNSGYTADRNGKLSDELTDGLTGAFSEQNKNGISGESST